MQSTKKCPICEKQFRHNLYYHYGGISCGGCQAFFRRMTRSNRIKHYQCLDGIECRINYGWRVCKHCRYKSCLDNGMDPKLIMKLDEDFSKLSIQYLDDLENFFDKIAEEF